MRALSHVLAAGVMHAYVSLRMPGTVTRGSRSAPTRPRGFRTAAWAAIAVVHLTALGCRTAPEPRSELPQSPLRGIDFLAEITVPDVAPARVSPTLTIRNRRAIPATLTFPTTCLGLLRAYDDSDRTAPVWEQSAAGECPSGVTEINVMPAEERKFPLPPVEVREILGSELPAGTYRFTVVVAPDGQVLEVDAGEKDLTRSSR